ncbi:MAG: glycosyltransferase family 4 protein [Blastocatellia bacterium]
MRIAQVSPLYERVPPKYYGGTERVVSYLTEELVRQGHQVTLFASGDSATNARLIPACKQALRLSDRPADGLALHMTMVEQVFKRSSEFDIIHFHIDYLHFPVSSRVSASSLTTLHGRLDVPGLESVHRAFPRMPVISISDAQRTPLPWLNWQRTVHHGLPRTSYSLRKKPGKYLAFLGRISPEKRVDVAIEIARRAGMPIKIAAKVDAADKNYYESNIRALLKQSFVDYVGEIGENQKDEFLGNAYALLFPIDWPEPFGLVMIESIACGTPVIAFRRGSVSEVLDDGVTGFICDDIESAVRATTEIEGLSRIRCRSVFEDRFSVERMARDYVAAYGRRQSKSAMEISTVDRPQSGTKVEVRTPSGSVRVGAD